MIDNSGFKDVKPFDFRQIRRLPPRIEKKLEEVNYRFAQNLILFFKTIAGERKEEVLVSSQRAGLEPITVKESGEKFDFAFQIESGQLGRFKFDRNLASHLLSLYLGYPTEERVSPGKLTKIEEISLFKLTKKMVTELQNAWIEDIKIDNLNLCYGRESGQERLIVSRFSVNCGTISGEIEVGYPLPVLNKVSTEDSSSSIESKQKIKELIEDSEVELTCVLGNVETHSHASLQLTLNQIAELKPGNVILMDREGDSEVTILIQEKNRFRGAPGIYNSRKGVKIVATFS
ncbi:MAG: FliM/FliN family flagellar motor switch protein [candidate division Zixibacteria bacterium]|nr:FliM/FliN family flagellar motor switch protein [candidate division Zixibacteria bacterium]